MEIYMKVTKTIALGVKSSDTIEDVKAKFCNVEGVSENLQELFFAGNHLKNDKNLVDYNIQNGSTIHMFVHSRPGMKIHITASQLGARITLDVNQWDTIHSVKTKIQEKEGFSIDTQILSYVGKLLDDSKTLADYNIPKASLLDVHFCTRDRMQIFVSLPMGRTIKLEVKLWNTVENVKTMIEGIAVIPKNHQRLIFLGKELKDEQILVHCNMKSKATLHLFVGIEICVRRVTGEISVLEVLRSDIIDNVKIMIENEKGIPMDKQILIFSGAYLEDDRTLVDYDIQPGSTIYLAIRK